MAGRELQSGISTLPRFGLKLVPGNISLHNYSSLQCPKVIDFGLILIISLDTEKENLYIFLIRKPYMKKKICWKLFLFRQIYLSFLDKPLIPGIRFIPSLPIPRIELNPALELNPKYCIQIGNPTLLKWINYTNFGLLSYHYIFKKSILHSYVFFI